MAQIANDQLSMGYINVPFLQLKGQIEKGFMTKNEFILYLRRFQIAMNQIVRMKKVNALQ
jgi:hypothetical protein